MSESGGTVKQAKVYLKAAAIADPNQLDALLALAELEWINGRKHLALELLLEAARRAGSFSTNGGGAWVGVPVGTRAETPLPILEYLRDSEAEDDATWGDLCTPQAAASAPPLPPTLLVMIAEAERGLQIYDEAFRISVALTKTTAPPPIAMRAALCAAGTLLDRAEILDPTPPSADLVPDFLALPSVVTFRTRTETRMTPDTLRLAALQLVVSCLRSNASSPPALASFAWSMAAGSTPRDLNRALLAACRAMAGAGSASMGTDPVVPRTFSLVMGRCGVGPLLLLFPPPSLGPEGQLHAHSYLLDDQTPLQTADDPEWREISQGSRPPSPSADASSSALAFLATALRDQGNLPAACALLAAAMARAPPPALFLLPMPDLPTAPVLGVGVSARVLVLVHALEAANRAGDALRIILAYLRATCCGRCCPIKRRVCEKGHRHPAACVVRSRLSWGTGAGAPASAQWTLHLPDATTIIEPEHPSAGDNSGDDSFPLAPFLIAHPDPSNSHTTMICPFPMTGLAPTVLPTAPAHGSGQDHGMFVNAEGSLPDPLLDALALLMTAVKILYLMGRLGTARALVGLLEPHRAGRSLHNTSIRNEAAYCSCLCALLHVRPMALSPPPVLQPPFVRGPLGHFPTPSGTTPVPIYVLGDSHVLPMAWRILQTREGPRRLLPALATGIKVWHLRPESTFFPKQNFLTLVDAIPEGSEVLFVLGEIDCREGLLSAVQKGRYPTLQHAIRTLVDLHLHIMGAVCQRRYLTRGYVMPVPPVLDPTRWVCTQYNCQMADRFAIASGVSSATPAPPIHPALRWLDEGGELLSGLLVARTDPGHAEEGLPLGEGVLASEILNCRVTHTLRRRYALDGTHLHPRFVEDLLAPAISRAQQPPALTLNPNPQTPVKRSNDLGQ
ncbi:hypothetical protein PAPYR_6836 [Paratrimastix pyriformis]|uniref:Uncharacterized protein n=1 Tax=Paratrimastix pyriformis TaxID=342808 RepID=A0ABQ8UFQ1_9EUKA|nr:hypothetical protein PAPYR_6836 [Paratrimastix pyriformis]